MRNLVGWGVVVHTRDGQSLDGVLVGQYPDILVLRHASARLEDGRREQLTGEVVVPRENVSFIQGMGRA